MQKITTRIRVLKLSPVFLWGGLGILALALLFPSFAGAQSESGFSLADSQKNFASILGYIVKMLTFLSFLMLDWAGHLFGTELIMGPEVEKHLLPIWRLVRNYTNIIFVLVLIYLALANMVASFTGQGNWTIKEKLPRIILALIAINFSFLGMKIAVDAVNVGTTAIFSIADTSLESYKINGVKEILEKKVSKEGSGGLQECTGGKDCKKFIDHMKDAFCPDGNKASDRCLFLINIDAAGEPDRLSQSNQTARNLTMSFGVFFQQLHKLPLLPTQISGSWIAILENTLFSSLMAVMYIIALAAVFVALIARVIVLWLVTAFSPALLAMSIMGVSAADDLNKKFITHLIMPLKVAAAFTFSFILISALSATGSAPLLLQNKDGKPLIELGPAMGQYFDNEYGFLWQVITIVVFWISAFWALEGTMADKIIQGIKSGAEQTGKFVAKASVIDRQVIPNFMGKGENSMTSLGALTGAPKAFMRNEQMKLDRQRNEDWRAWGLLDDGQKKNKDMALEIKKLRTDNTFKNLNSMPSALKAFMDLLKHGDPRSLENKENKDGVIALLKDIPASSLGGETNKAALVKKIENHKGRIKDADLHDWITGVGGIPDEIIPGIKTSDASTFFDKDKTGDSSSVDTSNIDVKESDVNTENKTVTVRYLDGKEYEPPVQFTDTNGVLTATTKNKESAVQIEKEKSDVITGLGFSPDEYELTRQDNKLTIKKIEEPKDKEDSGASKTD